MDEHCRGLCTVTYLLVIPVGSSRRQAIAQAYHKVFSLFKQNLTNPNQDPTNPGSVVAMTQDILVLVLPYLSNQDAAGLFDVTLSKEVLTSQDNGVQKRGYKILAKLVELGKMSLDVEPVIERLDEMSDGLAPAAKKVNSCLCDISQVGPNLRFRIDFSCIRTYFL
jgi:hypothetical protein